MTVSTRTLEIHGRILETPRVQFGNNSVTPRNGAWNVKDQKVMQPTKMLERQATWAMVDLADTDPRKGQDFTQQLKLCLSARGKFGPLLPPNFANLPSKGIANSGILYGPRSRSLIDDSIAPTDPVIKSGNPLRIPKVSSFCPISKAGMMAFKLLQFIEDAKNYKATFLLIILPDVAGM